MKRFIEVSTAFVYKSQSKTPASESAELQPWTLQAKYKLEGEDAIRQLAGLDVVFVRPAVVRDPTHPPVSFYGEKTQVELTMRVRSGCVL